MGGVGVVFRYRHRMQVIHKKSLFLELRPRDDFWSVLLLFVRSRHPDHRILATSNTQTEHLNTVSPSPLKDWFIPRTKWTPFIPPMHMQADEQSAGNKTVWL